MIKVIVAIMVLAGLSIVATIVSIVHREAKKACNPGNSKTYCMKRERE